MTPEERDIQLTAYALGELPPEEVAAIETWIQADNAAKDQVDSTRHLARELAAGLKNSISFTLEQDQIQLIASQAALSDASTKSRVRPKKMETRWLRRLVISSLAAAALVVLVFKGIFLEFNSPTEQYAPIQDEQSQGSVLRMFIAPVDENGRPSNTPATRSEWKSSARIAGPDDRLVIISDGIDTAGEQVDGPAIDVQLDDINTESYARIHDNAFLAALDNPLSTFSIDVDTASYANVRRFLTSGNRPPPDAVRIEEMLNYFDYAYSGPADEHPFAAHVEVNQAPWNPRNRLVRIGIKGKEIAQADRPAANLVFLIDVSGSMQPANKLPLLREAMKMLVSELRDDDRVAMVVYAGSTGLVLDSTPAAERQTILDAIDSLTSGGSTNGGAGIQLAYDVAVKNFVKEGRNKLPGVNRVVLCTDGDFNVGVTSEGDLTRLIEEKAKTGMFLTVLGFGMGNLKDANLEKLADKGNGNYGYIDTLNEARKMLIEQMGGTLVTIAKDVKIQVEFNPAKVASYRLIGYENRLLAKEDFNDDLKDAGEIGAGHTVTALYEVVPVGDPGADPLKRVAPAAPVDPLKYQAQPAPVVPAEHADELLTLKLRYKAPDAPLEQGVSTLIEFPIKDEGRTLDKASEDYRFAAAVAGFGMLLRDSPHKGDATYEQVLDLAGGALGADRHGYRREFVTLVETARRLPAKP